ncbi:MBL fold metallo-hydrolase [Streptomyces sp. NBC_01483]|uniref:MBL fold metallo-hydrolase n=1 Tax=Streptomyces sp. NBC_01483 TaxID=2903883 RepID=UPI002E30C7A7|nr:MBL fold metallo-hydrolase [Streptomyces sp. NBC_01483]
MALGYDVLVTLPPPAVLPDGTSVRPVPAWSPIASTLIYGERDAILVDAPHTEDKAREVADWVAASGKNLLAMYATHGHGDRWFGFAEVAKRFPDAQILGTKGTVALAQYQTTCFMDYWNSQFPGQIVKDVIVPTPVDDHTFDLEGHEVRFVEAGDSDTQDTTFVHVPDLGLAGSSVRSRHRHQRWLRPPAPEEGLEGTEQCRTPGRRHCRPVRDSVPDTRDADSRRRHDAHAVPTRASRRRGIHRSHPVATSVDAI